MAGLRCQSYVSRILPSFTNHTRIEEMPGVDEMLSSVV